MKKLLLKDKTAKDIWISINIKDVHPLAFDKTANYIEGLSISGQGFVHGTNPIEYFPLHILETFPNLRWFMLQETMLSDKTFEDSKPPFSDLVLPNIGTYLILILRGMDIGYAMHSCHPGALGLMYLFNGEGE